MLPAAARMRSSAEFAAALRASARSGGPLVVVHARPATSASTPARVGFVVSRRVGDAVVRNRLTRRLRHILRDRLEQIPPGTALVVRALPPAASATSSALATAVDTALSRLLSSGARA